MPRGIGYGRKVKKRATRKRRKTVNRRRRK